MAARSEARDDRIEIRTTKEEKRLLMAAAEHERLDLTSFIMRSMIPIAHGAIEGPDRIVLSERDSRRVLDLLENPPEPPLALIEAMRRRPQR